MLIHLFVKFLISANSNLNNKKKAAEARKKQKTVDVKEIQLRPMIGDHDYDVKLKNARSFSGSRR